MKSHFGQTKESKKAVTKTALNTEPTKDLRSNQ